MCQTTYIHQIKRFYLPCNDAVRETTNNFIPRKCFYSGFTFYIYIGGDHFTSPHPRNHLFETLHTKCINHTVINTSLMFSHYFWQPYFYQGGTLCQTPPKNVTNMFCYNFFPLSFVQVLCYPSFAHSLCFQFYIKCLYRHIFLEYSFGSINVTQELQLSDCYRSNSI